MTTDMTPHPGAPEPAALKPGAIATLYHARTKHRYEAYAAGPGALDWDAQPATFRHYDGAPQYALPHPDTLFDDARLAARLDEPYARLGAARPPLPATLENLGALLRLSLGLTAWKSMGPDRWPVRANPSSGNLHPVEAWVVTRDLPDLPDGVYHYRPETHALECRASDAGVAADAPRLMLALSTVGWREAWKYGERAFRYCQLDVGHALGALRAAAAVLGWGLQVQPVRHASLAARLGLDRVTDFPGRGQRRPRPDTEREEAEVLLAVGLEPASATGTVASNPKASQLESAARQARWHGEASCIDPRPLYRWPLIDEVTAATRRLTDAPATRTQDALEPDPVAGADALRPIGSTILGRRSAQRFDSQYMMSRHELAGLLASLRDTCQPPLDLLPEVNELLPVLFVQRVEGLPAGLYAAADPAGHPALPALGALGPVAGWTGLWRLGAGAECFADPASTAARRQLRSLHCHQDIAAHACLALGLLAPLGRVPMEATAYRELLRAAGLIGQALYLAAEARGLRGTGIGCYFDDPVHDFIALADPAWQSVYHFTIGRALDDPRIETTPAYLMAGTTA